jgi:ParB family chromosome partitioning protein
VEEGIRQTLDALAAPIALHEVLQPLVVEPGEEGRYSLQIGKRRLAASKIAGLDNVPAIILDGPLGAEESLAMRLVENIHREHALALLRLEPYQQIVLAEEVIDKGLTMPETRDKVREILGKKLKWRLVPIRIEPAIYDRLAQIAPEGDVAQLLKQAVERLLSEISQ